MKTTCWVSQQFLSYQAEEFESVCSLFWSSSLSFPCPFVAFRELRSLQFERTPKWRGEKGFLGGILLQIEDG